jgi:predicted kinase
LHLRSDVLRKRRFAVLPETPLPTEAYRAEVSARVYTLLAEEAETALAAGQAVVVDAVFAREGEREAVAKLATRLGVPFTGFWLDAPADVLKERAGERTGDASDATPQVVERQLGYETGSIDWIRLDASAGPEDLARQAKQRL